MANRTLKDHTTREFREIGFWTDHPGDQTVCRGMEDEGKCWYGEIHPVWVFTTEYLPELLARLPEQEQPVSVRREVQRELGWTVRADLVGTPLPQGQEPPARQRTRADMV